MTETDTQSESDVKPESAGVLQLGNETWHDVEYVCHECENRHKSVDYVLQWLSASVMDWDPDKFKLIKKTVVYNFNRARYYPNDFEAKPQPCPHCSEDLGTMTEGNDTHAWVVEKDDERSDYVSHLHRLCPEAWEEDNP
jgi:glutaredoxin